MLEIHISGGGDGKRTMVIFDIPWLNIFWYHLSTGVWLHWLKFPSWPKVVRDKGERYSLSDWYGDLGCVVLNRRTDYMIRIWKEWDEKARKVEIPLTDEQYRDFCERIWLQEV